MRKNKKKYERQFDEMMDKCMDLHKYCTDENTDPEVVSAMWRNAFTHICKTLGIGRKSARVLFGELAFGNWEHLHRTDKEKEYSSDDWLRSFAWDVFYCSDRWSVDRLTRCHWYYRRYMSEVK